MGVLLPHLAGVVVERIEQTGSGLRIRARPRADEAPCGACGRRSGRVHSRYERRLADPAVGGQRVVIWLRVRRFFCDAANCVVKTFAEQVEGLTSRYARRSPLLRRTLEAIGLAMAGRAGVGVSVDARGRPGRDNHRFSRKASRLSGGR